MSCSGCNGPLLTCPAVHCSQVLHYDAPDAGAAHHHCGHKEEASAAHTCCAEDQVTSALHNQGSWHQPVCQSLSARMQVDIDSCGSAQLGPSLTDAKNVSCCWSDKPPHIQCVQFCSAPSCWRLSLGISNSGQPHQAGLQSLLIPACDMCGFRPTVPGPMRGKASALTPEYCPACQHQYCP